MPILNSCCCWKSIRRASYACAIYSMVYYVFIAICLWMYIEDMLKPLDAKIEHASILLPPPNRVETWVRYLIFTILGLSLAGPLTSFLLMIGIWKDKKLLLLPWVCDAIPILILEVVHVGYLIYMNWTNPNPAVAMIITVDFFCFVLNLYSLLCVISQYQEFSAGRGRAVDAGAAVQFSRNAIVSETGKRTTAVYESKAQVNGISPRQSRMSVRSASRGPSIKISRADNGTPNESSNNAVQTSSESYDVEINPGTCTSSLTGDSSSVSREIHEPFLSRPESKKKVQFPSEQSEEKEGESVSAKDGTGRKVLSPEFSKNHEESPLIPSSPSNGL